MAAINKLSDKQLKAILGKPYTGRQVVSDGAGLSARISPKGKIAWVYRYRLGGRNSNPKWLGLGSYPDTSIKQAREKRDQCREWLDNGLDPAMEIQIAKEKRENPVTVADALEYWVVEYAAVHRYPSNADVWRRHINNHITPYIGHFPLDQVTTKMWVTCFDRMRKGVKGKQKPVPVLTGNLFQTCKQALLFCRKRGFAVSHALNDLRPVDIVPRPKARDRVLTDEELSSLVQSLMHGDDIDVYYRRLILLLIIFGARSQEVRLSQWQEWDFDALLWVVPKKHSKNGETITRPIPEAVAPYLKAIQAETGKTDYLLGGVKAMTTVSNVGRSYCKRLEHQTSWSLHDLRRTMATRLNDLGTAPHIVDHLLGHVVRCFSR